MQILADIFSVVYLYLDSISFLLLSALGLIIILGMMGITNMAHGELMMIGAYVAVIANRAGMPLPLAIILAGLVAAVFGLILERLVIRKFYGNLLQSLVATWGISLILSQGMLILLGPSLPGVTMPLGGFNFGGHVYATYRVVLAIISILIVAVIWWLFKYTKFGMRARATMQNAEVAQTMGVDTTKMYFAIFGLGSGLAGLAGALYAPTTVITPLFGTTFLAPAFVTVVVSGGANVITGSLLTSGLLGIIEGSFSRVYGTFIGRLALLVATIFIIRFLPTGISGYLEARGARKK
ncbi:MAG: ABC transporter permease subunit [Bacteroidota bacterium]